MCEIAIKHDSFVSNLETQKFPKNIWEAFVFLLKQIVKNLDFCSFFSKIYVATAYEQIKNFYDENKSRQSF